METEAVVTRIEGTDVMVELANRSAGCGRCHEPGGCGGGSNLFGQLFGTRTSVFRVRNSIGAQVGERVLVRLGEREILRTALAAYFLPIVLLVAGAFGGMVLAETPNDSAAFTGGIVGFAAGVLAVTIYQSRARKSGSLQPVLTRRSPCCDPAHSQD
ncbi:MAG: SoxR reducing system RseC family protein [Rhodocyclaceae bacterium]|jgi:sigma-E factor negative regulatory protein RseC